MAFQTLSYFLLLTAAVLMYYILPHRFRWALLLVCSYFFYSCWNAAYALLMLLSTIVTYAAGLLIAGADKIADNKRRKGRKRLYVALSLAINLGILFVFKYLNMFLGSLEGIASAIGLSLALPRLDWLLPVGISFYTFQALGYTLDVYRGETAAVKHFGKYALFVSFFPQLVAGPIERSSRLLKQFDEIHRPDFELMRSGAMSILIGLIKKLVIADRLAMAVDIVYNNPAEFGAPAYIVAAVCFAFQIYCDFSGYSDIAVGSASLMGFRLMRNFDSPYLSGTVSGFWRRWHISLSGWFRDYVYFPLGGSRVSLPRWMLNNMVVFLLSGLWHGADWTFVIWGALNGLYIVIGKLTAPARGAIWARTGMEKSRLREACGVVCTFVPITFAWLFFRANDTASLTLILGRLFTCFEFGSLLKLIKQVNGRECAMMLALVAALMGIELAAKKRDIKAALFASPLPVRWAVYIGLLFLLILFGKYNESPAFIYFQF